MFFAKPPACFYGSGPAFLWVDRLRGMTAALGSAALLFSVAARRNMVCPTASRPIRVTVP